MRKIPLKNYMILFLICLVTIIITFYLRNKYLENQEYINNNNSRMGFLQTVTIGEFADFSTENRNFIFYASNSNDDTISTFEYELKNMILENNYTEYLFYINMQKKQNKIINKYTPNNLKINDLPYFAIVENGQIVDVLYPKNVNYDLDIIIKYIEKYIEGEQ